MLYLTLNRLNSQFYVQNALLEKALAYVELSENADMEGNFWPDAFVFKVGVPTLMEMKQSRRWNRVLGWNVYIFESFTNVEYEAKLSRS